MTTKKEEILLGIETIGPPDLLKILPDGASPRFPEKTESVSEQLASCLEEILKEYLRRKEVIIEGGRRKAETPNAHGRLGSSREKKQIRMAAERKAREGLHKMISERLFGILINVLAEDHGAEEEKIERFARDVGGFFASLFQGKVDARTGVDRIEVDKIRQQLAGIGKADLLLLWEFWGIRRGFASGDDGTVRVCRKRLEEFSGKNVDRIPPEGILSSLYSHVSHLYPDPQSRTRRR